MLRRSRGVRGALAAGVLAALVACGGGTAPIEPFVPERYFALGDETSVITQSGSRYTVNPLNTAGTAVDCRLEPIWVQALATRYGFVFAECNPDAATTFKALMRAAPDAKVADVRAQIDAQVAAGGFGAKDLASVLAGTNDIVELYSMFPARGEEQLIADARARGEQLAAQVNRLVGLGPRVIVATIPDVGVTPYALRQKAAFSDTDRAALLSRLTAAFNARLRVNILNDGRFVGLILGDELTQTMVRAASAFGLSNVTEPLCTVAAPECTSATVVSGGTSANYLWAHDRLLTFAGQQRLGSLAVDRATNNPF